MTKEVKKTKFTHLVEELKYLDDDFPSRADSQYIGNDTIKGIEKITFLEFHSCIIFEMAKRNEKVIEIIEKLNYLEKLTHKYPYLQDSTNCLFKPIAEEETELPTVTFELEEEYTTMAKLPILELKKQLSKLIDIEYSNNFIEPSKRELNNLTIDTIIDMDDSIYEKCKFKDLSKKTTIDDGLLTYGKLHIIIDYLQDTLKYEFFIYPNGYYKVNNESCHEKLISKELLIENEINLPEPNDEIRDKLIEFLKLKPTDIKAVADYFFMYDSNKKRINDGQKTLIAQDIKFALTKYHGIQIEGIKDVVPYEDCLKNYDIYKDLNASFDTVERAIRDKITLMENFIDNKYYRYLLFT